MVKLGIQEDRVTPKEVYGLRVHLCAAVVAVAATMIGYDSAFIGTSISLASFREEFGIPAATTSASRFAFISANIVSVYTAGCFFGAFAAYPLGFYLGRRWGLIITTIIFMAGAAMQCAASSKTGLGIMYAGRIIVGLCVGIASNLAPQYLSEVSPPAIRGRLVGLYELGWQVGSVTGFFINYGISLHIPKSNKQWIIAFAVQVIPAGMLGIGCIFIPESPRWLASRDRNAQALKSLAWLRNLPEDAPYVQEEFEDITTALEADRAKVGSGLWGPFKTLFSSRNLMKRLLICCGLFVGQAVTGINAIAYYSPTVFKSIGVTGTNTGLLTTGVFGIIKFLAALVWLLYLVDRYGRRKLLLVGCIGGSLCMYAIAAYIAIADPANHPSATIPPGGIVAMVFLYLWTCFYGPTWNGTPWVVSAESFPQHVRPASAAFTAAANWLTTFIIARFTPNMFLKMKYGTYIFFASGMILAIFFVYFFLPETKGVPLERMNDLWAPGLSPRRAHGVVMSRTRDEVVGHDSPQGSTMGDGEKQEEVYRESV